jgi:hypothetical protein
VSRACFGHSRVQDDRTAAEVPLRSGASAEGLCDKPAGLMRRPAVRFFVRTKQLGLEVIESIWLLSEGNFMICNCRESASRWSTAPPRLASPRLPRPASPHPAPPRRGCAVAVPCRAVPCRALPCLAVPCRAVPCLAVPCRAVPCRALPCLAVPCRAVPCRALPWPCRGRGRASGSCGSQPIVRSRASIAYRGPSAINQGGLCCILPATAATLIYLAPAARTVPLWQPGLSDGCARLTGGVSPTQYFSSESSLDRS